MTDKFQCRFCKKEFVRERTIINHLCEQRRRWTNKDEHYVRLGFHTWLRWYEITGTNRHKKTRTYEDFMKSKYYIAFTKFGKHVADTNMVNPKQFIEFVIKRNIKLDDWCKNTVYETYVRDVCKREDVQTAVERVVILATEWAEEHREDWTDFFRKVSPGLALKWIVNGRISPWILLNAKTSPELLNKMDTIQLQLVNEFADPGFWKLKMNKNPKDQQFVTDILGAYEI